ncbi:DEKNAAC100619 [Brettanomyces naardenensis]|uniref:DEKNAAC100619 n=1 Tax=Brettanomyces naardenensis TaxID=13370 RepID=A0A448YGK5_BRENA|nr:DEKNAAC100619 [Brettanomyces naardenensis]
MTDISPETEKAAESALEGDADNGSTEKSTIDQLSLQLLEQTERNSFLENSILELNRKNSEMLRQIYESRKMKEESDREVEKLSTELEDLSATLFTQANIKVKEANIMANDYKVRNSKLVESLKQKDELVELLNNELQQLKDLFGKLSDEKSDDNTDTGVDPTGGSAAHDVPVDATFVLEGLQKYNNRQIYTPIYNQLRFDLHAFNQFRKALASQSVPFNIRDSSFFRCVLTEEIEPVLRLDLSPGVKFYQRRSFITSLMDYKVTIEPLSASTEVWKSSNSQHTAPGSPISDDDSSRGPSEGNWTDLKLFKYGTSRPVANLSKCSICGEARSQMNFSRLYKLKIKDYEYTLCVSCANKLRCVVELLKYLKGLKPTSSDEVLICRWCELSCLRGKLYYTKLGLWSEADEYGLVYGWKNVWLGQNEALQLNGNLSDAPPSSVASITNSDEKNIDDSGAVEEPAHILNGPNEETIETVESGEVDTDGEEEEEKTETGKQGEKSEGTTKNQEEEAESDTTGQQNSVREEEIFGAQSASKQHFHTPVLKALVGPGVVREKSEDEPRSQREKSSSDSDGEFNDAVE